MYTTVSKWDEKPVDDTRKGFPINIAHVEYDIDGELKGKAFVEYLLYYLDSNVDDGHLATSKISGFLHFCISKELTRRNGGHLQP
ncbi:Protein of unknown function [Bacillus mycoides]|nr:Protein of unknown function [Bacillus mycoides]